MFWAEGRPGGERPVRSGSAAMDPVAIITGAGSGIGRELAVELAERNFRLVLAGRREEPLMETREMLRAPCIVVPTNVRDPEACNALVTRAVEEFSRLDVLVNNAGYAPCIPLGQH